MQVREYTRACVRAFVRSCVRSCVRALVRSLSQFISPIARTQWALASYYLWLWIGAVYKFGGTLTDYKYRLSRSEYIISSFIISNLELEHRATTAATNKFPLWWRRWRWWFRTRLLIPWRISRRALRESRSFIPRSTGWTYAHVLEQLRIILYTNTTFELPKKGSKKGLREIREIRSLEERRKNRNFFTASSVRILKERERVNRDNVPY